MGRTARLRVRVALRAAIAAALCLVVVVTAGAARSTATRAPAPRPIAPRPTAAHPTAARPTATRAAARCVVPGTGRTIDQIWRPGMSAAIAYAHSRVGDIAFAVRTPDRFYGYRPDHDEWSASVVKAMLLVTYLDSAPVRNRALTARDMSVLGPMIRISDNDDAQIIFDTVGQAGLQALARRVGMTHFATNPVWGETHVTPRDQTRFFLHIDGYVVAAHRSYAMRLLRSISPADRWGIGELPLPGWRLYFKGGWGYGTGLEDHQVVLLTRSCARVSLAVLTMYDGSHPYGKATLKGIFSRLLRGFPTVGRSRAAARHRSPAAARRPSLAPARATSSGRRVVIGHSVRGRPIAARVLGPDSAPRKLLLVGCIHGNECAGTAILSALARERVPAGVQLWLVAEMNPDGTAAGTRQNADGVDLNRNFPFRWERDTDPTYDSGPRPASEPETRAAMALIRRIRPAVTIWYHQHMDLVDMPGGDRGVARRYAQLSGLARDVPRLLPGECPAVVKPPAARDDVVCGGAAGRAGRTGRAGAPPARHPCHGGGTAVGVAHELPGLSPAPHQPAGRGVGALSSARRRIRMSRTAAAGARSASRGTSPAVGASAAPGDFAPSAALAALRGLRGLRGLRVLRGLRDLRGGDERLELGHVDLDGVGLALDDIVRGPRQRGRSGGRGGRLRTPGPAPGCPTSAGAP